MGDSAAICPREASFSLWIILFCIAFSSVRSLNDATKPAAPPPLSVIRAVETSPGRACRRRARCPPRRASARSDRWPARRSAASPVRGVPDEQLEIPPIMALSARQTSGTTLVHRGDPPLASNATIPSSMLCTTLAAAVRGRGSPPPCGRPSRAWSPGSFSISRNDATSVFASARAMGAYPAGRCAPRSPRWSRSEYARAAPAAHLADDRLAGLPRLLISRISRITSPTSLSFSLPAYRVTPLDVLEGRVVRADVRRIVARADPGGVGSPHLSRIFARRGTTRKEPATNPIRFRKRDQKTAFPTGSPIPAPGSRGRSSATPRGPCVRTSGRGSRPSPPRGGSSCRTRRRTRRRCPGPPAGGPPLPVQTPEDRRAELRDGHERDDADLHQRRVVRHQAGVQVSEEDDGEHRGARGGEQVSVAVEPLPGPENPRMTRLFATIFPAPPRRRRPSPWRRKIRRGRRAGSSPGSREHRDGEDELVARGGRRPRSSPRTRSV